MKGKPRAFALSPLRSRLRQMSFAGLGRSAGEAARGFGIAFGDRASRRLRPFAPRKETSPPLLRIGGKGGSKPTSGFAVFFHLTVKKDGRPLMILSSPLRASGRSIVPPPAWSFGLSDACPIMSSLSDLALASPPRFALRVYITALCKLPLLRSPKTPSLSASAFRSACPPTTLEVDAFGGLSAQGFGWLSLLSPSLYSPALPRGRRPRGSALRSSPACGRRPRPSVPKGDSLFQVRDDIQMTKKIHSTSIFFLTFPFWFIIMLRW